MFPLFSFGSLIFFAICSQIYGQDNFIHFITSNYKGLIIFTIVGMVFFSFFGGFATLIGFIHGKVKSKLSKNKITDTGKMPFKEKVFNYLYKQLIPIITVIIVLCVNPVDDKYFYGAAILCFSFVVYAFYDLVKEHNEIISNKLPQLEKRGGDEHD